MNSWSIDEKMGNTYIWEEKANTLEARDFKQPQAVLHYKKTTKDGINTKCHKNTYGVVSKGDGSAWVIPEKHMSLTGGGGQAGQGFPCVLERK